jgi:hypothetical protein
MLQVVFLVSSEGSQHKVHGLGSITFELGVPYTKRICRGCDLGKVEDEEHLLLVCSNTQKVKEHIFLAFNLTHTSSLVELMQTMNTVALAKFVACCQYQKTICPP